jgi:hypothetical protein
VTDNHAIQIIEILRQIETALAVIASELAKVARR